MDRLRALQKAVGSPLVLTCCVLAPLHASCVQLIAFEQPIVGTPDVIAAEQEARVLCDDQVTLGMSAACDVSCTLESDGAAGCDERVRVEAGRAHVDVSGMQEVEITLTACDTLEGERRLGPSGGGGLALDDNELDVQDAAGESLHHERLFFSSEMDECEERTVLFQNARLELVEAGARLCEEALPRLEDTWEMDLPAAGLESIELCLRRPR